MGTKNCVEANRLIFLRERKKETFWNFRWPNDLLSFSVKCIKRISMKQLLYVHRGRLEIIFLSSQLDYVSRPEHLSKSYRRSMFNCLLLHLTEVKSRTILMIHTHSESCVMQEASLLWLKTARGSETDRKPWKVFWGQGPCKYEKKQFMSKNGHRRRHKIQDSKK